MHTASSRPDSPPFTAIWNQQVAHLFMQAPSAIAVVEGPEQVFVFANPRYQAIFGRTQEQLLGRSIRQVWPELEGQGIYEIFETVYRTGQPYEAQDYQAQFWCGPSLVTGYYQFVAQPLMDQQGQLSYIMIQVIDVTQLVKTRQDQHEQEEHLHYTVELNPQVPWTADAQGNIDGFSQRWLTLTGLTAAQALGEGWMQVPHPDDRPSMVKAWLHSIQTGEPYDVEHRIRLAEGTYKWMRSRAFARKDSAGRVLKWYGSTEDIAAQKSAQLALEQSHQRITALIEEAPVATSLYTGPELVIEIANEMMITYWGKDHSVIGKPLAQALPELQGQPFLDLLDTIFRSGTVHQQRAARADLVVGGKLTTFYFDYTYKPLRNDQGQVYAILNMAIDVTEQVKTHGQLLASEERYRSLSRVLEQQVAERTNELVAALDELASTNQELTGKNADYAAINEALTASGEKVEYANRDLAKANQDLARSNQNLEQFAYVASHDLQEPLRKIQQFGDLLKSRLVHSSREELVYLDRMQLAASRMSQLIKDLLAFSRLATSPVSPLAVDLNRVLTDVLDTLSVLLEESGAQLEVDHLPVVAGDALQFEQLFQNLLTNAIKFSGRDQTGQPVKPRIRIGASQLLSTDLPGWVKPVRPAVAYHLIEVTDNGIGFEEHYRDRIFQVFQRLHGKGAYAGTGIGLAICEKVVSNHGGAITARSQPGQGATFSVYLPK
ncbi:PAS domain-containing protein (plasmid) [Spirosoma sp. SC4-14]|uniref:PAS domain-containing sensor histidine kinase n=1 Tax=Spirosoma sp. SC4-14 TaxID=3128900 RepID=UPI0030D4E4A6